MRDPSPKLCAVLSSVVAAEETLKDRDMILANRGLPATVLASAYTSTDMMWVPYGPHWRMIRKVCVQELLRPTSLDAVYWLRRREVRRAVGELHSRAGEAVGLREHTHLTALNVMTGMLWGGALEGEERISTAREFQSVADAVVDLISVPNISDFFPTLARFDLQGLGRKMRRLSTWINRIFDSFIDRRLRMNKGGKEAAGGGGRKDFLQVMLELMEKDDSQTTLTLHNVKALFQDMVAGATDTTSTVVEWAMAELLHHPELTQKAQEDLDAVLGKDDVVEESHIHKLYFLEAAMKETLRLHPPLPLMASHCPSSSCTLGGYEVPEGTSVFVNVPSVWEEALEFRPERFLKEECCLDYNGKRFGYLPFGSGRRICVGVSLAERTVMYMLASLLHAFEWRLPEGGKGIVVLVDMEEKFGIILRMKEPLVAVPMPRLARPELYEA